ncbi:MAG: transglutaminase domain-containing protein [Eubacteriales bacterium]
MKNEKIDNLIRNKTAIVLLLVATVTMTFFAVTDVTSYVSYADSSISPQQSVSATRKEITPDEYYGRNALKDLSNSDGLLYAYDQIVNGVENCSEKIDLSNGPARISLSELKTVMAAYDCDYPQHFWVKKSYTADLIPFSASIKSITMQYSMSGKTLENARVAFENEANQILSGINFSMSDYEIELYLHDAIAENVDYILGYVNSHNAYGAIVNKKAVCDGYSKAFQYLLRKCGIQALVINGYADTGHAWNIVKIDGKYYHTDVTFDDASNNLYHEYFNVSTTTITKDRTINDMGFDIPDCVSDQANYFSINSDKKISISDCTADRIASLFDADLFAEIYVNEGANAFINWLTENINSVARKLGIKGNFTCTYRKLENEVHLSMEVSVTQPEIVKDPVNASIGSGNSASISCTANGNKLSYQWYYANGEQVKNNGYITGSDTSTLKVSRNDSVCGKSMEFYCVVSNSVGTARTDTATITINHCDENNAWEKSESAHFHTCSCGATFDFSEHNIISGTCVKKAYCSTCYQEFSANPNKHNLIKVDGEPATCKSTGIITHWKCSDCNKLFKDNNGTTEIVASNTIVPVATHSGGTATCTEKATCSYCGAKYGVLNTNNHKNTVIQNAVPATYESEGYSGDRCCVDCGKIIQRGVVIPKDKCVHTLEAFHEKPATCTENGNIQYWICSKCERCFDDASGSREITHENIIIYATGHSGGIATCCSGAICEKCGVEYGEKDASNHNGGTEVRNDTDEYTGDVYCVGCGVLLEKGSNIAMGHRHHMVKHQAVKATCKAEGNTEYYSCSDCNKTFADVDGNAEISEAETIIRKSGHDYDQNGICTVCGNEKKTAKNDISKYYLPIAGVLIACFVVIVVAVWVRKRKIK